MKQLELREYPRAEIAEILSVNLNDSGHFKRNVENKLKKWGYGYHYETAAVEIISKPETPEDRLSEILLRVFGIDIQVNPIQFACFVSAFTEIDGFDSMPWGEREKQYYLFYGFCVDERTLRNWCSQLIRRGIVIQCKEYTCWRTDIFHEKKTRRKIEGCEKDVVREYTDRKHALYAEYYSLFSASSLTQEAAKKYAWKKAYEALWSEFGCCYYYCKSFTFTAFTEQEQDLVLEVYELVQEIVENTEYADPTVINSPTTKEQFDRQWFL